ALPDQPARVTVLRGAAGAAAADWLEADGDGFFARDGQELIVVGASPEAIAELAARFELRGGSSAPVAFGALASAVTQAGVAARRSSRDEPVPGFDDVAAAGMLALL